MDSFKTSYQPKVLEEWMRDCPVKTIPQLFERTVSKYPLVKFLGRKVRGRYRYQTYRELDLLVRQFASALIELGMEPGDRIAQISNNRPEWVITDLGTMSAGGVHAPLYATVSKSALSYILNDSESKILVAENEGHLELLRQCQDDLNSLEDVVCLCDFEPADFPTLKTWTWSEFLSLGANSLAKNETALQDRKDKISPTDCCSLIYTSGTTGEPKGAMLMHGNFLHNALSLKDIVPVKAGEIELSFLPLSHVFERTLYYFLTAIGGTIAYAQSFETVAENMLEVQPHFLASVPRLYEKIYQGVKQKSESGPAVKRGLVNWALRVGKEHCEAKWNGHIPTKLAAKNKVADKLVFSKIREKTGGRIRVFASGGAPLRADVCEFFLSAGFRLIEGYGLTETSPVITINPPDRPKIGTVGTTIEAVEIKIAEDNEILSRGPHIMLGYFNKPEATKEAIDEDGWFYTGDIGEIDDEGYLKITDRKKELIVLSNGKNVPPSPLEQAIKESPYIEQCVVLGDKRNFISALVVPCFANLTYWCEKHDVSTEPVRMVKDPHLVEYLMEIVTAACADFSRYEQVKKIALLPREFSQEMDELTPTLKTKRRVVQANFQDEIESIYGKA